MKVCKYCGNELIFDKPQKYGAHITNCKQNPNKIERDIKSIKKKEFNLVCACGEHFTVLCTEEKFMEGDHKKFCSRSCANVRKHTIETKNKISVKLSKPKEMVTKNCTNCDCEMIFTKKKIKKFCSRSCSIKFRNKNGQARNGGLKSCLSQNRRSKNEVYFAELCESKFDKVLKNETIFDGWDADVIIEDYKIAVLWNGIWHYKKITNKHSLKQVQNRDSIKLDIIKKCGYTPYIIQDLGKFDIQKVNDEWDKFNLWLSNLDSN